jgi:hypothetical protein
MFSLPQNGRIRGQNVLPRSRVEGGQGRVAQIMYTHVSKCKNDKKKQINKITTKIIFKMLSC